LDLAKNTYYNNLTRKTLTVEISWMHQIQKPAWCFTHWKHMQFFLKTILRVWITTF